MKPTRDISSSEASARREKAEITCIVCGKKVVKLKRAKYCSDNCRQKAHGARHPGWRKQRVPKILSKKKIEKARRLMLTDMPVVKIAETVGVSVSTLYGYFPEGKNGLQKAEKDKRS